MNKTVKEIHEKRSVLYNEGIKSHKKYINKNTGLYNVQFIEYRNCPVCEKDSYLKIFDKEGGTYVKCKNCDMVYLNPVFTNESLTDYYKNNHALQSEIVESDLEFYLTILNLELFSDLLLGLDWGLL